MPVRARTSDVLQHVNLQLDADALAAAGNSLLSLDEERALPPGVLKDAAERLRDGRLLIEDVAAEAKAELEALLGTVNTRGPALVSQAEVRALYALNVDAAVRVARASELITGRTIVLPTEPVIEPPPGPAPPGLVPMSNFVQDPAPQMPYAGPTALLPDGTLEIIRGAMTPSTFTFDAAGRTFTATVTRSSGQISNVATPADVVEAIRNAVAPDLDVRVTKHASSGTVVELHVGVAPPPDQGPLYLFAAGKGIELRGALRFVINHNEVLQPGEELSVRIDDVVYRAPARQADTSVKTLMRSLRDQARAGGRTIDLREYTNYAPWTFIVTG